MAKHVFIIAGEASGDEHAAKLVTEINQTATTPIYFSGIGGSEMTKVGVEVLYPLAQYGVTGFSEVFKQFKHIRTAFHQAKNYIQNQVIDLLILVDYPGFNLRFAKIAKQHNIKILYYISPQIWAWKAKRIHTIKNCVNTMAVILPFEKKLYSKAGIPAYYVGNPLTETTRPQLPSNQLKVKFSLNYNKILIGLLPGSRLNEIKQLLPTMLEAANKLNNLYPNKIDFVLPIASSLNSTQLSPYLVDAPENLAIIAKAQSTEVMACCHTLIVASGTASLQAALLHIPTIIAYRTSKLSYIIATQVIQCAYIGLANLIAGKMIIPEFIQNDFSSENLCIEVQHLLNDKTYYLKQAQRLKKVSEMLENKSVDCRLAELVFKMLDIKII